MNCNICSVEISEGSLCSTCSKLLGVMYETYDAKALSNMFVYLMGGKIVDSIQASLVEKMQEEYGTEILNQTSTENPQ